MRTSFFAVSASLVLFACSGSSSNDVLGPTPGTSSTVDQNNPRPPSDVTDPNDPNDDPPKDPPKDDDPPPKVPPPNAGPPATPAECDAFAAKFCAKAEACDGIVSTLLGTSCAQSAGDLCKARLAAPGTGFTSAALAACGNAYASNVTCEDAFGAAQMNACNIKGTLPANAKCAFSDQCASGYCTGTANDTCGTCATPPASSTPTYVGLGEACDLGGSGPQCNSGLGLWCDSATKKCEPILFAAIGQPCGLLGDDLVMCASGGTCKWGTGGTGTCVAQKAIGEACTAASGYEECAAFATCVAGKCAYPTAAAICK